MSSGKIDHPPVYQEDEPLLGHQEQPGRGYHSQQHVTSVIRDPQKQPMPNDYLVSAILVTFFCCLPFGIVAIIKSSEVRNRYAAGDYGGAQEASKDAKKWSVAGLVTGAIVLFVVIVLNVIVMASA